MKWRVCQSKNTNNKSDIKHDKRIEGSILRYFLFFDAKIEIK